MKPHAAALAGVREMFEWEPRKAKANAAEHSGCPSRKPLPVFRDPRSVVSSMIPGTRWGRDNSVLLGLSDRQKLLAGDAHGAGRDHPHH